MPSNKPRTAQEFTQQLTAALKKHKVQDVDDILVDYEDYFAQSKAKGYSDKEAVGRLPSVEELAASYGSDKEDTPAQTAKSHPSSAQRKVLFGATLAGDILLLPFIFIVALLLVCFAFVGIFLVLTGPLLFIPDSLLGQLDVARPPVLHLLPTALLFASTGIAIVGVCVALFERMYSAYRASIVVRRWLLTGTHNNHLKLIPSVAKKFRIVLYKTTLIAGATAVLLALALASLSWFTTGTTNFPSTWNL